MPLRFCYSLCNVWLKGPQHQGPLSTEQGTEIIKGAVLHQEAILLRYGIHHSWGGCGPASGAVCGSTLSRRPPKGSRRSAWSGYPSATIVQAWFWQCSMSRKDIACARQVTAERDRLLDGATAATSGHEGELPAAGLRADLVADLLVKGADCRMQKSSKR